MTLETFEKRGFEVRKSHDELLFSEIGSIMEEGRRGSKEAEKGKRGRWTEPAEISKEIKSSRIYADGI